MSKIAEKSDEITGEHVAVAWGAWSRNGRVAPRRYTNMFGLMPIGKNKINHNFANMSPTVFFEIDKIIVNNERRVIDVALNIYVNEYSEIQTASAMKMNVGTVREKRIYLLGKLDLWAEINKEKIKGLW